MCRIGDVAHRRQFGQTNVTSRGERVSRFTFILKNPNTRRTPVMGKIIEAIKDLSRHAPRSHPLILDQRSWIGRTFRLRVGGRRGFTMRPHLGKKEQPRTPTAGPDVSLMTDNELEHISDRRNDTPRTCLGWKPPAEAFREKMLEGMR